MGWDGYDDVHLHLHTCLMLRNRMFHVGVGWGGYDDVHLHLHTCLMLRNRMFHVGVGWGGYDDVHLHLFSKCYAMDCLGTYFTHVYNL